MMMINLTKQKRKEKKKKWTTSLTTIKA